VKEKYMSKENKTPEDMQQAAMEIALILMEQKFTTQQAMAVVLNLACILAKTEELPEEKFVERFLQMVNATRDQVVVANFNKQ